MIVKCKKSDHKKSDHKKSVVAKMFDKFWRMVHG